MEQITLKKNFNSIIFLLLSIVFFTSCKDSTNDDQEYTTVVMTTELINDSTVFAFYDSLHSKEGVWPELKKANMASGIKEIEIYRYDNRVMMMLSFPRNADPVKMDSLYLSADKRVKEWTDLMSSLQRSLPGIDTTQKWVPMKLIHHYSNGEYLK
jgi:L-rhamnose mutarotase